MAGVALPSIHDVMITRGGVRTGVACTAFPGEPLGQALARLGLNYGGEAMREIQVAEALSVLSAAMSRSLAHGFEVIPANQAEAWVSQVVSTLFPREARLFTNQMVQGVPNPEWAGTKTLLNIGVIAVTPSAVACVWIEEED
jgi:hypothetical protein